MQLYAVYQSSRANSLQMKSNVTTFHLNQKWKFIVSLSLCIVSASGTEWRANERMVERPHRMKCFLAIFPCQNPFAIPNERHFTRNQTVYTPLATIALFEMIYLSMAQQIKEFEIKINIITFRCRTGHTSTCLLACSLVRPTKHSTSKSFQFLQLHQTMLVCVIFCILPSISMNGRCWLLRRRVGGSVIPNNKYVQFFLHWL